MPRYIRETTHKVSLTSFRRTCKILTSSHKPFSHNVSQIDMAICRADQKRTLTEHFKQRAVIKFCANSELTPTETWTFLENITVGKRVLDRSFLTGTSDFGKVERTSVTISEVGYPLIPAADLSTFKSQLRGTRFQKKKKS